MYILKENILDKTNKKIEKKYIFNNIQCFLVGFDKSKKSKFFDLSEVSVLNQRFF